jgi:hypothetical protein
MKKAILAFLLLIVLGITTAQTPNTIMENMEAKVRKLLATYELPPVTEGGIGERIDVGLSQLLAAAKPAPQLTADVNCVVDQNCAPLIQGAINAAPPEGKAITINAGTHLLSSAILINKSGIHLRGQGESRTVLTYKTNVGMGGSAGLIFTGADILPDGSRPVVTGIAISDLTIRGTDPLTRVSAIRLRHLTQNMVIRNVRFEGITSSAILINGWRINNITIVNNSAREYYEQFVEVAAQFSADFLIANNHAYTTKGHPNLGSVEPFPVAITPGHAGNGSGLIERVRIVGNRFEHFMATASEAVNTVCVQISEDQASKGYQFGFHDIYVIGNYCRGQGRGFRLQLFRTSLMPVTPRAYFAVEQNEWVHQVLEPVHIGARGATTNDLVLIQRNLTRLREAWPPYKIEPGATVTKVDNTCIHPKKPEPYQCN